MVQLFLKGLIVVWEINLNSHFHSDFHLLDISFQRLLKDFAGIAQPQKKLHFDSCPTFSTFAITDQLPKLLKFTPSTHVRIFSHPQ